MEMSHQPNTIEAELSLLCNQGYYTSHVGGHFKNDLSFICAFINDKWYNLLRKLTAQY